MEENPLPDLTQEEVFAYSEYKMRRKPETPEMSLVEFVHRRRGTPYNPPVEPKNTEA